MRNIVKAITSLLLVTSLVSCANSKPEAFEVSDLITNANNYISENKENVVKDFRNNYHLMAPVGWINDPNGFSEFNDKYHLFYQYNPYSAEWNTMHWGHQTTKDFIKWNLEDVALAPDKEYDQNGCFSGTAFVEDGVQYLAYTAVTEYQNQALAYSKDGKTYKKLDDLLLDGSSLPDGFSNNDFRDPKLFKRDGKYYIICGNKDNKNNKHLIMFESNDVKGPYKYVGVIYKRNDLGGILECPDLLTINETDVLICSPQSIGSDYEYEFQNNDSCAYLVGSLSTNTYKYYQTPSTNLEEFDKGFSFYAPQTMKTSDGRSILVAWMRSWSEPNLTKLDGWCGSMTLPRELRLENNHIYQAPVREIRNYFTDNITKNKIILNDESKDLTDFNSRCQNISFELDVAGIKSNGKAGIEIFKNSNYSTKIYYDAARGYLVFDRANCGSALDGKRYMKVEGNKIKLDLYLDNNSVEIFVNDGYYTMSGTAYAPLDCDGVSLFATNGQAIFNNLERNKITIK